MCEIRQNTKHENLFQSNFFCCIGQAHSDWKVDILQHERFNSVTAPHKQQIP